MDKELLGYRNYRALKNNFHKSDFDNVKTLQKFLNEVLTGESDITDEGIKYLNEAGLDIVSKNLAENGGLVESDLYTTEEIQDRLSKLVPHETAKFIAEARNKL